MSNFVSLLAALSLIDAASVVWRLPERHIYKKTKFKGEQTMELPFVAGSNDNVAKFCISTTFRDLKK